MLPVKRLDTLDGIFQSSVSNLLGRSTYIVACSLCMRAFILWYVGVLTRSCDLKPSDPTQITELVHLVLCGHVATS